jgi:predicted permease
LHGPFGWLRHFHEDVRFSARQVRRAPGHAVFTVLVLALGIGTVTAMFTIAYAVLLKPLPFEADRRLYLPVQHSTEGEESAGLPFPEIVEWQRATQGTAEVAFSTGGVNIADGPAGAALITEVEASQNLFPLLGAKPFMGRGFLPEEEEDGHADVVVLSYALWQQNFGGNRNVLGKTLHIGGNRRTVVGVMPPEFLYPVWENRPEVWVPVERSKLAAANSDWYSYLTPLVRVKAGVPVKDVEAQLARVHAHFAKPGERGIRLVRVRDWLVGDVRPGLLALGAAVCVVWLIACINVAGLLLARVSARRAEIAMRVALGARRQRIAMQFLTECLLLSCIGAAGGLALAVGMLRIFRHLLSARLPLGAQIELNWVVWAVLLGLTVVTTLAFGAGPALLASRTQMGVALRSGGARQTRDRAQSSMRSALLVTEVALSVMLLIGAGLMLRTMYALRHVPLGFNTDHLVVTSLTVPNDEYKDSNVGTVVWQPLLDEVRSMPGVRAAALATVLPIEHPFELVATLYRTEWMNEDGRVDVRAATPGLMDALGVRMRSGRFFTAEDTAASLPVVVVNRTFVNRYLGGGDGIGKQVRYGHVPRTATIVGVMEDVHQDGVAAASEPELYACMTQLAPGQQIYRPLLGRVMQLAVRTGIAPDILIPELRRQIQRTNPHLAIGATTTMAEAVEDSIGAQKLAAQVIGVFGGLVLLITVVGLYGLLSYQVAQRTQEIGIRMALGADRARVVRMVLRQTLIWLGAGTVIGVALAAASGQLMQAFLFGVHARDPWVMSLAPAVLVVCGLLAAIAPARRASAVDPAVALRGE